MACAVISAQHIGKRKRQNAKDSAYPTGKLSQISYQNESLDSLPAIPAIGPVHAPKSPSRPLKYPCPYNDCDKLFSRPVRLEEHIRSHTNDRPFKCPHKPCEKAFIRQSHLSHHVRSAHTAVRTHVCNFEGCGKSFVTGTRLRRHLQTHESKERFVCTGHPPCEKSFKKKSSLQKHIDFEHLNKRPHSCQQLDNASGGKCKASFMTAKGLRSHQEKCHQETRYWCSLCESNTTIEESMCQKNVGFNTYSELQLHMKKCHPVKCVYCGEERSSDFELKRHIDIHHSGKTLEERKTFVCEAPGCGKSFVRQKNLDIHTRSAHEKKKPFKCGTTDLSQVKGLENWDMMNACHASFTSKQSLVEHVRKFHLDSEGLSLSFSKEKGPAKGKTKAAPQHSSILSKLTGSEEVAQVGDHGIVCPVLSCGHLVKQEDDIVLHARLVHGMDDDEIIETLAEREALSGGRFWVGGVPDVNEELDVGWQEATGLQTPGVEIGGRNFQKFTLPSSFANDEAMYDAEMNHMLAKYVQEPENAEAFDGALDPALLSMPSGTA